MLKPERQRYPEEFASRSSAAEAHCLPALSPINHTTLAHDNDVSQRDKFISTYIVGQVLSVIYRAFAGDDGIYQACFRIHAGQDFRLVKNARHGEIVVARHQGHVIDAGVAHRALGGRGEVE